MSVAHDSNRLITKRRILEAFLRLHFVKRTIPRVTTEILVAEFFRAQAAWRLAHADGDPVRAARCAAALLDAAAYVATLTPRDTDLAALAAAGCFQENTFDPGEEGELICRWWQFGDPPYVGPRDLLAALSAAASQPGTPATHR
jgi:hypothetical protein